MNVIARNIPRPVKDFLHPIYVGFCIGSDTIMVIVGVFCDRFLSRQLSGSYLAMIRLFCYTRGISNDIFSKFISFLHPPFPMRDPVVGMLGSMSKDKFGQINASLKNRGYFVFENRLSDSYIDEVFQFAMTNPCRRRKSDEDPPDSPELGIEAIYDRNSPRAARYEYDTNLLLNSPVIQKIIQDDVLLQVAQQYLGCKPIIDIISLWWHTSYKNQPDAVAAQYYHFDMDRPKWIKFFIHITDVNTDSGPHCFIQKSHQRFGIPKELARRGYQRISDDDVYKYFGKENEIEFCAPRGTVIAEDTRGLHKGKHCTKGDRLILQLQYTNSLFGGSRVQFNLNEQTLTNNLKQHMQSFPRVYQLINASSKNSG